MKGRRWTPVGADLVSDEHEHQRPGAPLRRTLIRYDSDRLARLLSVGSGEALSRSRRRRIGDVEHTGVPGQPRPDHVAVHPGLG